MFDPEHPIANLKPASYNPRHISDESIAKLQESIRELGVVKPVIVRNNTLVAGHQRTKALKLNGALTVPAYLLASDVNLYDEVRFNQLHNGTDLDSGDEQARISGEIQPGFQMINHERISGNQGAAMAVVRDSIEQLVRRYGPWGACVATLSGEIIHCGQYALASQALRMPVLVFGIPDAERDRYARRLNAQYGVFSYDHLEKLTYIQTKAQPNRRVAKEGDKGFLNSSLYMDNLVPFLNGDKERRVIDFGSGKGDHARDLRQKGYNIIDVELFRRIKGKEAIDVGAVNLMIDRMARSVRKDGPFETVICDSVINSVDSNDAEKAVMTMLNVLTKMGGDCFFAGRTLEKVHARMQSNHAASVAKDSSQIEFLSADGFTAVFTLGHWLFQKFHDEEGARNLALDYGFDIVRHDHLDSKGFGWQIHGRKARMLPWEQVAWAIDFEFSLPLSKTRRIEKAELVKQAFAPYYEDSPIELREPRATA